MTASRRELALAAASGFTLGAAFLTPALGWLAWVAFVPLLFALEARLGSGANKRALFTLGYAGGLVFFLSATHWIALLSDVAITVPWLKYIGWLLASAYLAVFWGLATLLAGWLSRRCGVNARWTFVAAMLVIEELRGSGEMGFPWFQPGYTQHTLPPLALASLGSVTLVTLWVLLLNASCLSVLRRARPVAIGRMLVLLVIGLCADAALFPGPEGPPSGPPVAIVQGNIPGEIKWSGKHQGEIIATFLALSDSALAGTNAADRPVMVVWPETATGSYLRKQLEQSIALAEWSSSRRTMLFTGFADYSYSPTGEPQPWNAAGSWNADGSLSTVYAKRHLVPFGERMPFQKLVPALGKLDFGQAEWMPGTSTVLFPGPSGPFSSLVCFESIFPSLAREDVRRGSRMLVVVTNDEWFGRSVALEQHAAMSAFRAVENGVPLVRCANTGVSEVIDHRGHVVARAPEFVATVLRSRLPRAAGRPTGYGVAGDWPGALALLAVVLLATWRRSVSRPA